MTESRPRSAADKALDVLDAGLQRSTEHGYTDDGYVATPVDTSLCARCERAPHADDGDLCEPCRSFLLGDTDRDPRDLVVLDDQVRWVEVSGVVNGRSVVLGVAYVPETGDSTLIFSDDDVHRIAMRQFEESVRAIWFAMRDAGVTIGNVARAMNEIARALDAAGFRLEIDPDSPTYRDQGDERPITTRRVSVAREREIERLNELRRSHRRTNRFGPPPGRR